MKHQADRSASAATQCQTLSHQHLPMVCTSVTYEKNTNATKSSFWPSLWESMLILEDPKPPL